MINFKLYYDVTAKRGEFKMNRKTILLADDNKGVRDGLLENFRARFPDYRIEAVIDGTSADERLSNGASNIALAVLDNNMPGIKGLDLIKKHGPKLDAPIILYSGDVDDRYDGFVKDFGGYAAVEKPYLEKLLQTADSALKDSTLSSQ